MKKITTILLLVCLCMLLAACADSGAAQAASAPAETSAPAAETETATEAAPTPEAKKEPVNLQPLVDELNAVEMEQRKKEIPFMGVYLLTDDNALVYQMAIDHFEVVVLGATLGGEEYIEGYNETVNELPAMCAAIEEVVHIDSPDTPVYIYLMLTKDMDQAVAVANSDQILYDAINGVGDAPEGLSPIVEPETTPEATPAA